MGYIPKTSSPEVTTNALRFVLSGGVYIPPQVLASTPGDTLDDQGPVLARRPKESGSSLGLTDRQVEVLRLMARGRSNKDIAAELDISAGTVKMHVSRIFRVLNVGNRTEAAAKLAEFEGRNRDVN